MKTHLLFIILLSAFTAIEAIAVTPEEEARFAAAAKKAFDAHDASGLAELTYWDGVPETQKQITRARYEEMVKTSDLDVSLVDRDPKFADRPWTKNGVAYHANLPVTRQLQIVSPTDANFKLRLSVGEKDGKLCLTGQAPVK